MGNAIPLPSESRILAPLAGQSAFPFVARGIRPSADDFPRPREQPAVVLDLDDNCRRLVGMLLAPAMEER